MVKKYRKRRLWRKDPSSGLAETAAALCRDAWLRDRPCHRLVGLLVFRTVEPLTNYFLLFLVALLYDQQLL